MCQPFFSIQEKDAYNIHMTKEEAVYLYQLLEASSIPTWIIGGWGIDALLGE